MKRKPVLGRVKHSARGFECIEFTDRSDQKCSLQVSSLADYVKPGTSALWLGVDDPNPLVLAQEAHLVGVKTNVEAGWVPYPIPEAVLVSTRAHLSRKQVEALIRHLQAWLNKDTLKP